MVRGKVAMTERAEPAGTARRDLVEREIFDQAIRLFAERGFAGTSLQDIASAAGLTRPALYYYVKSKDQLLTALVQQVTVDIADALEAIGDNFALAAVQRLRAMVHEAALRQARDPARFLLVLRSEAELPAAVAADYHNARRRVLAVIESVISEGIENGSVRPVDTRIAALAITGMVNWIAWWHNPGDPRSAEEIATDIADLAMASLHDPRASATGGSPTDHALALLEEDVRKLKSLLSAQATPAKPAVRRPDGKRAEPAKKTRSTRK